MTDLRPSLLRNGTRIRTPRRDPAYRFDVRRSEYDQAGLVVFFHGELELRWKGRKKREPRWFCGCCGRLVLTMHRHRFYWLCAGCLEQEVGPLARLSKDRRNLDRLEILMRWARWRCGDFTDRWIYWPPSGAACHLRPEAWMRWNDVWEATYTLHNRMWTAEAEKVLGW